MVELVDTPLLNGGAITCGFESHFGYELLTIKTDYHEKEFRRNDQRRAYRSR